MRHLSRTILLVLVALLLAPPSTGKLENEAFFRSIDKLDGSRLDEVRGLLLSLDEDCPQLTQKCPAARELQQLFGGEKSGDLLPMLVVYLDENLDVRANRLLWKGKVTPFVFGADNIWVVVFSERDIALDVGLVNVWQERGGMIDNLERVFISAGKLALEEEEARRVSKPIPLEPLGDDVEGDDRLWVGWQRFYLQEGAAYRVRILPADEGAAAQAGFRAVLSRFTNSKQKTIDWGITAGFTFDLDDEDFPPGQDPFDDLDGIRRDDTLLAPYWMMEIYVKRPQLIKPIARKTGSRYRTSYAVAVGFNLNVFDLDQLILGLSIGHLFGRNGIVVGANFLDPIDSPPDSDRVRPFFGFNFQF